MHAHLWRVEVLYGRVGLVCESEGELVVPPLLLDLLPQPRVLLVQLLLHLQESKEGRIISIWLRPLRLPDE